MEDSSFGRVRAFAKGQIESKTQRQRDPQEEQMTSLALQTLTEAPKMPPVSVGEAPRLVRIELVVSDSDSIAELVPYQGAEREEYALCALRIGLLSLRHARGQIDADVVKHEGDRLLSDLKQALEANRSLTTESLTSSLREYFDPASGKFQERVERLIKQDGELEQVLRRQIGSDDSEMVKTLTALIGDNSPLMKILDPAEADGLVATLRLSVGEVLRGEREKILSQFSLDDKQSAISRLVVELAGNNNNLQEALTDKVEEVVKEFSLDEEDSALSRLVRKVEAAQQTITQEFSLDNEHSALSRMTEFMGRATEAIDNNLTLDKEQSALSRLKRELLDVLSRHEQQANSFQSEVKASLAEIRAKREEAARSTVHGRDFEDLVWEFVQREAQKMGDVPNHTGSKVGAMRNCKMGDAVITLGEDTAASGEKIVIEAKEDSSYDLAKACVEIQTARKNREAAIGLFVFSRTTAPIGQETLLRHGNDIFLIWDGEDLQSDINFKAALMVARALSVRQAKARTEETADFERLDKAILELEREARRLCEIKKWTETIKSNSGKVLDEVAKMAEGVQKQVDCLRETTAGLRGLVAG
jgi:hypothetical protein